MRGKNLTRLFRLPEAWLAMLAVVVIFSTATPQVRANELPQAAGSPLTGIAFDDRPLLLPVQRNFQMAMLTASSQIGRSCGRMESYGWRVAQSEQRRVNLIFSNTVDRLRGLGYTVEAQTPSSISKDITLFTADRSNKHFLFMWSAGEIGLVMVLCESSAPLSGHFSTDGTSASSFAPPQPQDVVQDKLAPATAVKGRKIYDANGFTPVGDWIGDYTCMRGYTGATMHIDSFKGEDFKGTFRFYPTTKNPFIPKGSYAIYGQYDRESRRILINPGKWIEHPDGYYKTIIIGSFDPVQRNFSGFFQGIMGCTSFEAKSDGKSAEIAPKKKVSKHVKPKKKKPAPKKPPEAVTNPTPDEAIAHVPNATPAPAATGANPASPAKTDTPPSPSAPVVPAATPVPAPSPAPVSSTAPATPPAIPSVTPPASPPGGLAVAPQPVAPAAPPQPAPNAAPSSDAPVPAPSPAPKPTSSLEPRHMRHGFMLVGDWPATQGPPEYPLVQSFSPNLQRLQPAGTYNTYVPQLQPVRPYPVIPPMIQPNSVYNTRVPEYPEVQAYNTNVPQLPSTSTYNTTAQRLQYPEPYNTTVPELPTAPSYNIFKPPGS